MPALNRQHYRGDYSRRSRELRKQANADPSTVCWRCGMPARPGDPWQAGHIVDADRLSPLAAEHASCNARAGGQSVRARRLPPRRPAPAHRPAPASSTWAPTPPPRSGMWSQ